MNENGATAPVAADRDRREMAAEAAALLSRPQKQLASKWFYDARGATLFDRITELPEYYLTRVERELLETRATEWLAQAGTRTLVELGPGSGEKAAILLEAMPADAVSVPVDISRAYLEAFAREMNERLPDVRVVPVEGDVRELTLPDDLPRPLVVAFLGSTIGNFDTAGAQDVLRRVRRLLEPGDRLLLGADLRKDVATLEAAYNDSAGVTAEFNRNILSVLNRRLGADFDTTGFDHVARYDEGIGAVEMHLRARAPMRVHIPDAGTFAFETGETIRTEISTKYDRPTLERLLSAADLHIEHWFTDAQQRFCLLVARPAG
jgi:L-histidine Nalpha-methyltransferase